MDNLVDEQKMKGKQASGALLKKIDKILRNDLESDRETIEVLKSLLSIVDENSIETVIFVPSLKISH